MAGTCTEYRYFVYRENSQWPLRLSAILIKSKINTDTERSLKNDIKSKTKINSEFRLKLLKQLKKNNLICNILDAKNIVTDYIIIAYEYFKYVSQDIQMT